MKGQHVRHRHALRAPDIGVNDDDTVVADIIEFDRATVGAIDRVRETAERQFVVLDGTLRCYLVIVDYQISIAPGAPWCRRGAITNETACGHPIAIGKELARPYSLSGALCQNGCFTPHEMRLAAAQKERDDARHAELVNPRRRPPTPEIK